MNISDRHEFRLSLPGLPELRHMVRTFAEQTFRFAGFGKKTVEQLAAAVGSAVRLVEAAVEQGGDEDLPITIIVAVDAAAVEVSVLEQGRPLGDGDVNLLGSDIPERVRPAKVFDRMWWIHRGPEGSELHLRRMRPHAEIRTLVAVAHRLEAEAMERTEHQPVAQSPGYRFRPFRESDSLEVARSIYEAYGYTYPNPDLFFPERITALNATGRLRSLVAETETGVVVGHYALERPDLGPIAEAGQAVVHHDHRGRGLMQSMRSAVEDDGRRADLLGIWSQPTARHPFSQKMNLAFGSVPCGLSLGTTPASTVLRGGNPSATTAARQSCFLYWHPLTPEKPLRAWIPESIAALLTALYAARGREVILETELRRPDTTDSAADAVHVVFERARNVGRVWADRIGADTVAVIQEATRVLHEAAGAEALFVDLPLDDPACAWAATTLLAGGFLVSGVGPRFHRRPTGAEDTLRLQLPFAPIDREGLIAEGELGRMLVDLILT